MILAVVRALSEGSSHRRPRERILAGGADSLSADELVAVVLSAGSRGSSVASIARDLLLAWGGIAALSRATASELIAYRGIGPARAARLVSAFQLGRCAIDAAAVTGAKVKGPEDVFHLMQSRVVGLEQERLYVLALNVRNVVIGDLEVARGTLCGVEVHPREVFRPLIRCGAAAAVLAHNHPSGDAEPSGDDLELTVRLRQVGELVGIPVLDHVVIGGRRYRSIAELLAP